MGASIVSSAKGTCGRDIIRKKIAKLEFSVRSHPSLVSVSVQGVDSNNTTDISIRTAASI